MYRYLLLVNVIFFAVAGLSGCASSAKTEEQAIKREAVVERIATVEEIDHKTRYVTLLSPKGDVLQFRVGDMVKNLEQVSVGDKVVVQYYESLMVQAASPSEVGKAPVGKVQVSTAEKGEMPAGMALEQIAVIATIMAIDHEKSTVTIKGPKGSIVTVKVRNRKYLNAFSEGDVIEITYTESLAVSVVKVNK